MTIFEGIVKEILSEGADVSSVNDAINKTYEVVITYHTNGKNENTGERLIQPVAYGTTTAGYPVIRAFQPYGDTTTKTPSWKYFRLDRITDWRPLKSHKFSKPPGMGFETRLGKFNPNGDETMSQVYNIASFDGIPAVKAIEPTQKVSGPVTKADAVKNAGNTTKTNPVTKQEPATANKVNGPITKQDVVDANTNNSGLDRLKQNLSNQDYISKAMTDAEYGDNNEENFENR